MNQLALTLPGSSPIQLPQEVQNINGGTLGSNVIRAATQGLLVVAVILCLFFLAYGGIKWVTSEGDTKNIQSARNIIIYAAIGLFIAFFSFMFINILFQVFGAGTVPGH